MTTLKAMVREADWQYKINYLDIHGQQYRLGLLRGLQVASQSSDMRTSAEQAVIEAALAMTGPRSPRLAMALGALRKERGLEASGGERKVPSLDTRRTAGKVVADGYSASSCDDCGSDLHRNG